jgi:hypothetical protein
VRGTWASTRLYRSSSGLWFGSASSRHRENSVGVRRGTLRSARCPLAVSRMRADYTGSLPLPRLKSNIFLSLRASRHGRRIAHMPAAGGTGWACSCTPERNPHPAPTPVTAHQLLDLAPAQGQATNLGTVCCSSIVLECRVSPNRSCLSDADLSIAAAVGTRSSPGDRSFWSIPLPNNGGYCDRLIRRSTRTAHRTSQYQPSSDAPRCRSPGC